MSIDLHFGKQRTFSRAYSRSVSQSIAAGSIAEGLAQGLMEGRSDASLEALEASREEGRSIAMSASTNSFLGGNPTKSGTNSFLAQWRGGAGGAGGSSRISRRATKEEEGAKALLLGASGGSSKGESPNKAGKKAGKMAGSSSSRGVKLLDRSTSSDGTPSGAMAAAVVLAAVDARSPLSVKEVDGMKAELTFLRGEVGRYKEQMAEERLMMRATLTQKSKLQDEVRKRWGGQLIDAADRCNAGDTVIIAMIIHTSIQHIDSRDEYDAYLRGGCDHSLALMYIMVPLLRPSISPSSHAPPPHMPPLLSHLLRALTAPLYFFLSFLLSFSIR